MITNCYYSTYNRTVVIWYNGYAISIAKKYQQVKKIQPVLRLVSKLIYWITGIVVLPTVSVAILKKEK